MSSRLPRFLAISALLPLLLGGCVAALVPVVAGGLIGKKQLDGDYSGADKQAEVAPPQAERIPVFAAGTEPQGGLTGKVAASNAPQPALSEAAAPLVPAPLVPAPLVPAPLANSALPLALGSASGPFAAFARHATERAHIPAGAGRLSALIDQASLTEEPKLLPCADQPAAVVIDLDPGTARFDLDDPPLAAHGLAEHLAALRAAGITVLWSANLPVSASEKLYTVLQASGLDPQRTDRLLLLKNPNERKQTRRDAAAADWCVLAIAGDRKGDFEEALEYLRDPDGPIGLALQSHIGSGWFLTPNPID